MNSKLLSTILFCTTSIVITLSLWVKSRQDDHSNESSYSSKYLFPVVLFIMLFKVVITFKTTEYGHSTNESC